MSTRSSKSTRSRWSVSAEQRGCAAGLLAALVFLEINGIAIERPSQDLYELTMAVAEGRMTKPEVAATLDRITLIRAEN